MLTYSIEERKKRWQDFISLRDRTGQMFQIDVDYGLPRPWPYRVSKVQRIEWALRMYELYMDQLNWLRDDRVPCLHVYTGTEIFAEAFGCKVYASNDNMPFALPLVGNAREAGKLKVPELGSSTLSLQFEIADELLDRAGRNAILQLPDIQSPLDIAALIWDKSDFYIALLEEKEAVLELMHKIKTLLVAFFDMWFARYGKEYIAHYPYYYMNGGITLSEDEIGVIDSRLFTEFALQDLTELSGHFGGLGLHCCANARHQWENLRKIPDLKLLNLVQPYGIIKEAYAYFGCHTSQMHSWCGEGEPDTWPGQYPEGSHVVMSVPAADKNQALEISEKLWRACGR